MKTAKDYLDEAHAVVKKIDFNEALEKHKWDESAAVNDLLGGI